MSGDKEKISRVYCQSRNVFMNFINEMKDIDGKVGFEIDLSTRNMVISLDQVEKNGL